MPNVKAIKDIDLAKVTMPVRFRIGMEYIDAPSNRVKMKYIDAPSNGVKIGYTV